MNLMNADKFNGSMLYAGLTLRY